MDEEQIKALTLLIARAQNSVGRGAGAEQVDQRVKAIALKDFGIEVDGVDALRSTLGLGGTPVVTKEVIQSKEAAEQRLGTSVDSPTKAGTKDFFALIANGATFGFADEIVSKFSEEKGAALRQRVKDIRALSPKTSFVTEVVASAVPTLLGGLGLRAATIAKGSVKAATVGKAAITAATKTGAVTGGLLGVGESEGDFRERAITGALGAAAGGLLGGGVGLLGAGGSQIASRFRNLPGKIAERLREGTGVSQGLRSLTQTAEQNASEVRARLFGPLEAKFKKVRTPEITHLMENLQSNKATKRILSNVDGELVGKDAKAPSLTQLQEIRDALFQKKSLRGRARKLEGAMRDEIDGLRQAEIGFRQSKEIVEGLEMGQRLVNADPGKIDLALLTFEGNPGAQSALREGLVLRVIQDLGKGGSRSVTAIKRMSAAGDEFTKALRNFFPGGGDEAVIAAQRRKGAESFSAFLAEREIGDKSFRLFQIGVREANNSEVVAALFKKSGGRLLFFLAAGAAGGAVNALLGGGGGDPVNR